MQKLDQFQASRPGASSQAARWRLCYRLHARAWQPRGSQLLGWCSGLHCGASAPVVGLETWPPLGLVRSALFSPSLPQRQPFSRLPSDPLRRR